MYENIVDEEPIPWPPGDEGGGVDGREDVDKEGNEGAWRTERPVCWDSNTFEDCSPARVERPV